MLIGTHEGVIKVRTFRRKAGDARWDRELFMHTGGLPWQPVPGRDSTEPPICVRVPGEDNEILQPVEGVKREFAKRSFKISHEHVKKHGLSEGCRGCLNADAGATAVNHTPKCRERFIKIFSEHDSDELVKIREKFLKDREG